jgi:hypothetical protein
MKPETLMSLAAELNETAIGLKFARRLLYVFTALAAISLLIILAERFLGGRIALGGHTDSAAMHEIIIDNDVLLAPSNMIRLPEQRRSGVAARLDLYLSWPSLSGYSEAERDAFNGLSAEPQLIFLSFEERAMTRDMSGRFEPIYKFLIEGDGEKGPGGLVRYALPAKAGYVNEALYVGERAAETPFVARCSEHEAENLVAACERDMHAGGNLSATLRFPMEMLGQWRELDAAVPPLIAGMIKTPIRP